ncbi:MAG: hypothetical protein JNM21_14580 [Taibaiella sp.]|nr:hypothetical protein [Taibaiella sp.]
MKALYKMNNLEKGKLLIALFPEELENMQNAIQYQCSYFNKNEIIFRKGWSANGFFTADFWYNLVHYANKGISKNPNLWKRPHWFVDQFFDGINAVFTINCLLEYAEQEECDYYLKKAIYLFFGVDKVIAISIIKAGIDDSNK